MGRGRRETRKLLKANARLGRETVQDRIPAKEVTAPKETVVKSFLNGSFPHLSLVSKDDESFLSKPWTSQL